MACLRSSSAFCSAKMRSSSAFLAASLLFSSTALCSAWRRASSAALCCFSIRRASSSRRFSASSFSFALASSSFFRWVSIAFAFSFCFASHSIRISSIFIWPVIRRSSSLLSIALVFGSKSMPFATANPLRRASASVAPFTVLRIFDSPWTLGSSSCPVCSFSPVCEPKPSPPVPASAFAKSPAESSVSSLSSTATGFISGFVASDTSPPTELIILATRSSTDSFSPEEPDADGIAPTDTSGVRPTDIPPIPLFWLSYLSCCRGVRGLYFIFSSIA